MALIILVCIIIDLMEFSVDEHFENHVVTVSLKWTEESSRYTYHINITPYLQFNFSGSTKIHLKVPYNTAYNVSVITTPPNPCARNDVFEVYYGELLIVLTCSTT